MTRVDLPAAPARRDRTPRRVSDCLWSWHGAGATLASDQGVAGVFARAATLASVSDRAGATYTAAHSLPAWEMRDLDGDSVREACGLRQGTSDFLTWSVAPAPQAMTGMVEFVELGSRLQSGQTLFAINKASAPFGASLWLNSSGSYYRINWTDGTTTRTATLTTGQPTTGDLVRLRWTLAADGALTLWQSINRAPETTATAAALALPASWAAGAVVSLGSRGPSSDSAAAWFRRAKLVAGIVDVDVLEAIR
jgi:hypothetical protein